MSPESLSVGALARQAGVSPQILRYYDRIGLLRPSARTRAGYRQYTPDDRARLDVIRTLRALDFDLRTIARMLRGATGVRAMAELHMQAIEHQARTLRRRAAVLRAALRHGGELDVSRVVWLQGLAQLERAEKAGFIAKHLGKRLENSAPRDLQQAILQVASIELPDNATLEQLDAWLELAEMVSDESFLAHYRERGARRPAPSRSPKRMWSVNGAVLRAIQDGVEPEHPSARPIAQRWLRQMNPGAKSRDDRAFAREWLRDVETGRYAKEQRFWALIAVLRPEVAAHPSYTVGPWLTRAVHAWVASPC